MKNFYRLGLDIGTNSLGWALWELGPDGPTQVIDMGVRVFSDGRETGKEIGPGESLAVQRRTARGMRRRRDRLLQRKKALVNFLVREKLWPKDPASRTEICKLNPYSLRAKAVSERLTGEELGRVLLHLCQRRGFKSNRKTDSEDDGGKYKKRIAALDTVLDESGYKTLGELLNARKKTGARFRADTEYYPDRHHYIMNSRLSPKNRRGISPI